MDDYISKPVDAKELITIVSRWIGSSPSAGDGAAAAPGGTDAPATASAVDTAVLAGLRELGEEHLRTLARLFLEDSAERVARLRTGLEDSDPAPLARIAHSLKGSASSFGARVLAGRCADLERVAPGLRDTGEAADLVASIEAELARVRRALLAELDGVSSATT
jgi:HPt (histidine-containing phosphotransfer) domain-containing protein